jgi:hypothetical protein
MKVSFLLLFLGAFLAIILALLFVKAPVTIQTTLLEQVPMREPEFRRPPIREYKPDTYKQVGLLVGEDSDIYPIYGRPSYAYNNRWNYYTTTKGHQVYPLPISNGDRNCTEDIGCDELYGNENISILGKTGNFKPTIYRVSPMVDL